MSVPESVLRECVGGTDWWPRSLRHRLQCLALTISYLLHLRVPFSAVVAVCISDLFLLRVIELAYFGFAGLDRMKESAILNVTGSLPRLIAICALFDLAASGHTSKLGRCLSGGHSG
jgi:hypothetical protein